MTQDIERLAKEGINRLVDSGMFGFWLFNPDEIDPAELVNMRPHQLIRAQDMNAIRFLPVDTLGLEGCIAGWISVDEAALPTHSNEEHKAK
jgi:hypothetical protein